MKMNAKYYSMLSCHLMFILDLILAPPILVGARKAKNSRI